MDEHRPNHSWQLPTWGTIGLQQQVPVGCDCHIKFTKVECRIHTKGAKVVRVSAKSNQIVQGVVHGYQRHWVWGCIHHSNELALTSAFSLRAHVHNSMKWIVCLLTCASVENIGCLQTGEHF